jgi:hypothetical protein
LIFQEEYDLKDKGPHVMNGCGHTYCRECIEGHIEATLLRMQYKCPSCRKIQTYRKKETDFPAPNIPLREEIEQRIKIKQ